MSYGFIGFIRAMEAWTSTTWTCWFKSWDDFRTWRCCILKKWLDKDCNLLTCFIHVYYGWFQFVGLINYVDALVGGLEHFLFFHILGISSSQLTIRPSFFRGVGWNKPPTSAGLSPFNPIFPWVYWGLSENSVPLHPMVNDHYPY